MLDLGINNSAVAFEVALEALGQQRQKFMQAIAGEKQKPTPSAPLIRYCEQRLEAIDDLQDNLSPDDMDTVRRILDNAPIFA